jgi:aconitate hydratase
VLPLEFKDGAGAASLGLDGSEVYSLPSLGDDVSPGQDIDLVITRTDGTSQTVAVTVRIDTPIEVEYYRHGGILPYVLREILKQNA